MKCSAVLLALFGLVGSACGFDAPSTPGDDAPTAPTVGFASTESSADEQSTALQIGVTLSPPADVPVTVAYSLAGGSASANDFTFTPGTLTFAPGETAQSIPLAIVMDAMEEDVETIELALSSPSGAELGTATHTVSIANDFLPRVAFAMPSIDVPEGMSATVELVLDKPAATDVSVQVAVTGGTASDADYTFVDGVTVTFPAGSVSQTVSLDALQDALDETDELVALALGMPSAGVLTGVTFSQDVKVVDDDAPPEAEFRVAMSQAGEFGQFGCIVELSAPSGRVVSIPFAVVASSIDAATPNVDYTIEASPLVFQPGETVRDIDISVIADQALENDETVQIELMTPADGSATLGNITQRTHTIVDNDAVTVQWAQANGTGFEGDSDVSYNITVTLSQPVNRTISVDIAVNAQTTANPSDFSLSTTTVTFPPNSTQQQFQFVVESDNSNEDTEVVVLDLVNPTNGATLGSLAQRRIAIVDDDGP